MKTDILEILHRGIAAVAQHVRDLLFAAGGFHAHDLSDLGSALRARRSAGGDGSLTGKNCLGAARAAGIAAAAAVCAGEAGLDLGQALIDLDLKGLGRNGQDQAEHDGDHAQHEDSVNNVRNHNFVPSLHGPHLQAGEAHECKGDQACGDQRDGEAFKCLGIVGKLQALAHRGEQVDRQQEAKAAGDAVHHGSDEVVVVLHVEQHHAENGAVGGDQRQVHAEGRVERRHGLFEEHLDELHEARHHENEGDGLHVVKAELDEDDVHAVAERRGKAHDERNGKAHTDGGVALFRHAEERADTQELREDEVIRQDRAEGNSK